MIIVQILRQKTFLAFAKNGFFGQTQYMDASSNRLNKDLSYAVIPALGAVGTVQSNMLLNNMLRSRGEVAARAIKNSGYLPKSRSDQILYYGFLSDWKKLIELQLSNEDAEAVLFLIDHSIHYHHEIDYNIFKQLDHPDVIKVLINKLGVTNKNFQWYKSLDNQSHQYLLDHFNELEHPGQRGVVFLLGKIKFLASIELLSTLSKQDKHSVSAVDLCRALGKNLVKEGEAYLLEQLLSSDPVLKRATIDALGRIKSIKGVDAISEQYKNMDKKLRVFAEKTVAKLYKSLG